MGFHTKKGVQEALIFFRVSYPARLSSEKNLLFPRESILILSVLSLRRYWSRSNVLYEIRPEIVPLCLLGGN